MKHELFRKFLHIACTCLILLLVNSFIEWYKAVFAMVIFTFIAYPVLTLAERIPQYGSIFSERNKGEVKMSLLLLSLMVIVLITVFWGLLGPGWKYIITVAVMVWGLGDAAAALVGKAFGRHFIEHRMIEGKKTVEGTLAMFTLSSLAVFVTTLVYKIAPWYLCLVIALLVAAVCTVVELFSLRGSDTITVPLSAAVSTFIIVSVISYLGG
jgi:phytol kinase